MQERSLMFHMIRSELEDAVGVENVSTPAVDTVASVVMSRQNAIALRNLLIQTLGAE